METVAGPAPPPPRSPLPPLRLRGRACRPPVQDQEPNRPHSRLWVSPGWSPAVVEKSGLEARALVPDHHRHHRPRFQHRHGPRLLRRLLRRGGEVASLEVACRPPREADAADSGFRVDPIAADHADVDLVAREHLIGLPPHARGLRGTALGADEDAAAPGHPASTMAPGQADLGRTAPAKRTKTSPRVRTTTRDRAVGRAVAFALDCR